MPFEFGQTINGGAEWLCESPLIFGPLSNPVITALLITALALVIIYAVYSRELKSTGVRRGAKAAIWVGAGVSLLIFVHYYALRRRLHKNASSQGVSDVMTSINHNATMGGGYPVLDDDEPARQFDGEPARQFDGEPAWQAGDGAPLSRADNIADVMSELGLHELHLPSAPGHRS